MRSFERKNTYPEILFDQLALDIVVQITGFWHGSLLQDLDRRLGVELNVRPSVDRPLVQLLVGLARAVALDLGLAESVKILENSKRLFGKKFLDHLKKSNLKKILQNQEQ